MADAEEYAIVVCDFSEDIDTAPVICEAVFFHVAHWIAVGASLARGYAAIYDKDGQEIRRYRNGEVTSSNCGQETLEK